MGQRILLIEDEAGLVMTLTDRLRREGYTVESREDGNSGFAEAMSGNYDLVLLDVMLPGKSGFDVCRDLRHNNMHTPVLMLTARGQVVDKVVGLKLGADDYLTKPFEMVELLARMEALLRRSPAPPSATAAIYEFGRNQIDMRGSTVSRDAAQITLSAREYQLLKYLIEHRGQTLSREELLKEVWGYDSAVNTRTVDVHMAWLRQKLEENPKLPQYLLTVRGLGYKFAG